MRHLPRGAFALLIVLLAGCSANRDVLIRIGERVVTLDEFKAVAKGNESQYLGTPDQAKAALFEDLLRRSLLLHEAEQRGMFRDSSLILIRSAVEERLLIEAMFQRLNSARPRVSEAEVARALAWRDSASRLLLIYTPDLMSARAAADELRRGEDFATVATRFNPPGLVPPGGDFGYVTPGSMVVPIDGLLRTAPIGETIGPVESPSEGWFVVRIADRQYRPQGTPESQRPVVREMLRQRKSRFASILAFQDLKREYGFRLEPGAGGRLYARYNRAGDPLAGLGESLPPKPGAADEAQVLARWDEGHGPGFYRLSDALDDLEAESRVPDLANTRALDIWIEQKAMRRVGLVEARRRQLDREPEIRRRVDGAVDNRVLQAIYEQDVVTEAQLFPLDVRAFYESVRGQFRKLDEVTVETATLADSALAQSVMLHGGHAPDLAAALAMAGAPAPVRTEVVRYPNADPHWEMLSATFLSLPPGQPVGPVRTPRGWQILRIVSKKQRVAEYDELEPMLQQAIQQQAEEGRRDAALRKVTEHLKKMYRPVLRPGRLDRLPWPVESDSIARSG